MSIAEKVTRAKTDLDAVHAAGYTEGEQAGYSTGYTEGKAVSYDEGYSAGKSAEWNAFWDLYQVNGTRENYMYAFGSEAAHSNGWTKANFKPKYDMKPWRNKESNCMFKYAFEQEDNPVDLVEILAECGVTLTFSKATSVQQYIFGYANISHVGIIDVSSCGSGMVFYDSAIETIDKFIVSIKNTFINSFYNCDHLKNIIVEGEIGRDINFQYSPLTVESMKSVISHLANYAGTDSELTYTVAFTDDCWTALEADSVSPNGNTWKEYVGDLGWLT